MNILYYKVKKFHDWYLKLLHLQDIIIQNTTHEANFSKKAAGMFTKQFSTILRRQILRKIYVNLKSNLVV